MIFAISSVEVLPAHDKSKNVNFADLAIFVIIDHICGNGFQTKDRRKDLLVAVTKTGDPTAISILRPAGRDELIRELHAPKLTVLEIREHRRRHQWFHGEFLLDPLLLF